MKLSSAPIYIIMQLLKHHEQLKLLHVFRDIAFKSLCIFLKAGFCIILKNKIGLCLLFVHISIRFSVLFLKDLPFSRALKSMQFPLGNALFTLSFASSYKRQPHISLAIIILCKKYMDDGMNLPGYFQAQIENCNFH